MRLSVPGFYVVSFLLMFLAPNRAWVFEIPVTEFKEGKLLLSEFLGKFSRLNPFGLILIPTNCFGPGDHPQSLPDLFAIDLSHTEHLSLLFALLTV
jgi:hypothetical protein